MPAPTKLFLDFNAIDGRWKVLNKSESCFGDGETPEQAIASARVVTDAPIFANSDFTGLIDYVMDITTKDSTELKEDDYIYNKEELIETLAELGGFRIYKVVDGGHTLGYTWELVE